MGAFIATLMRGAVDDSLQNIQRETSFWIITILVRYGVSFSIFLSSHSCNCDILRDCSPCRPWAT